MDMQARTPHQLGLTQTPCHHHMDVGVMAMQTLTATTAPTAQVGHQIRRGLGLADLSMLCVCVW